VPQANIEGRKSFLAGLASICVLLGLGVLFGSPTPRTLNVSLACIAGFLTTAALFAPWIAKPPAPEVMAIEADHGDTPQPRRDAPPNTGLHLDHAR
jgi:hypothetical protein